MRKFVMSFLFFGAVIYAKAQGPVHPSDTSSPFQKTIDSLQYLFSHHKSDTGKAGVLRSLGISYRTVNKDSCITYFEKAFNLSLKIGDNIGQAQAARLLVDFLAVSGDYTRSLEFALYNLQLAEKTRDTMYLFWATRAVWRSYSYMLEHTRVLEYANKTKLIVHSGYFRKEEDIRLYALMGYINAMAIAYDGLDKIDSAIFYGRLGYETAVVLKDVSQLAITTVQLGDLHRKIHDESSSFSFYRNSIIYSHKAKRKDLVANCYLGIAKLYAERKQTDSALYYGKLSLTIHQRLKSSIHELLATTFLTEVYAHSTRIDSAYKYQSLLLALKDSLFSQEKMRKVQSISYNETLRLQELERQRNEIERSHATRLKAYAVFGGLILFGSIGFFNYRLSKIRQESRLKTSFTTKIYQTEMRALRAQMNPHFIFNCLNSINRYIVKSDHKTASNYLTRFARLIRSILDNSASETITLDNEIQTLQLYLDIEKLRFANAFEYSIEVEEGITAETINIPSMLLQPYVENAIWHGLLQKESGTRELWVRFRQARADLLVAEIEDNGIGREKAKELKSKEAINKKSYGMQISKDRIFLINQIYNMQAKVQVEDLVDMYGNAVGTKVTVQIPVGHL
ncbi:sensor histidine kinase [Flavitalea antarctica]